MLTRLIQCYDDEGNVIHEEGREYYVWWGKEKFIVTALDQRGAVNKVVLSFAYSNRPLLRYSFLRVKPKEKGSRDSNEEYIFSRNQIVDDLKEKGTIEVRDKPNLRLVK